MEKFRESDLEEAFLEFMSDLGYQVSRGADLHRRRSEVLIRDDLDSFLLAKHCDENLTTGELQSIQNILLRDNELDLYRSNKAVHALLTEGFYLPREREGSPPLFVRIIDPDDFTHTVFRAVSQLEVQGPELRIPDVTLFINGIPLVHIELKNLADETVTLADAHRQLSVRYARGIPGMMRFNALCIVSDGANSKVGSLFATYDHFYTWRDKGGRRSSDSNSLFQLAGSLLAQETLLDVVTNFVYFPDTSQKRVKIIARYPQYYATNSLVRSVIDARKPDGSGRGGTYFSSTGSGKSLTMLFLVRKLMRSVDMQNPSFLLITDRTDLDDQLSELFSNSKGFVGENRIVSLDSRAHLREALQDLNSGGVFLTTIQKFSSDTELLSGRSNIVCISDEAHRSQLNLDKRVSIKEDMVLESFGFAKYLHDSLPNAVYVGVTGTPIDETLAVFGDVADAYTMKESVEDGITVPIVYEGRAARVALDETMLGKIEAYYQAFEASGSSIEEINKSKNAMARLDTILGDEDRLRLVAHDFVDHYEKRILEGASTVGKALFVASSRFVAFSFWKIVREIRPDWFQAKEREDVASGLAEAVERVKMVMTRDKDDPKELYDNLGDKDYRKALDRQFKDRNSNFRVAIVVDMWLTGFDVDFLDVIYIDKPIQSHSLIQTISRVNRIFPDKDFGLVVDYIGIRTKLNEALHKFSNVEERDIEAIEKASQILFDTLEVLRAMCGIFGVRSFEEASPREKLMLISRTVEHLQATEDLEKRAKSQLSTLSTAYKVACTSNDVSDSTRSEVHFFLAVKAMLAKANRNDSPDAEVINIAVRELVSQAIQADGIAIVDSLDRGQVDLFSDEYLSDVSALPSSNLKIKLLNQMITKSISEYSRVNRIRSQDFSGKLARLVDEYNSRRRSEAVHTDVLDAITNKFLELFDELRGDKDSFSKLGIDFEEKAFYDVLKIVSEKHGFSYPEEKLISLAIEVKKIVANKSVYTDWANKADIRAELKVDLMLILDKFDYPPIPSDEIFREVFEQAENFKEYAKS
jgi:type I restriction enzyme, R subunit